MKNTQLLLIFTVMITVLAFLTVTGCDEGMNMVGPVITEPGEDSMTPDGPITTNGEMKQPPEEIPGDNKDPGSEQPEPTPEPDPEKPEPTPEAPKPTVTIDTVVQADDTSVTISGTSTNVPEGAKVTVVLGDNVITVKAVVDENGAWTATVPARKTARLSSGTIMVKATAKKVTAESSFEIAPPPEPTLTIDSAAQADDGSVTISGTSTELAKGTTVTVVLGDTLTVRARTDSMGAWTAMVSATDATQLSAGTVPVTATASTATANNSFTYEPPQQQMALTLPSGYSLPPELIPTEETLLSANEQSLIDVDQVLGWDATAILPSTTNSAADAISLLPYKDREEVYELFVASVDLPRFAEAAQKMKEVNITLRVMGAERRITRDSEAYYAFLDKAEKERGLHRMPSQILEKVYFEENPEDLPHEDGNSRYWMILEWYRLQFAHPGIDLGLELFDLLDLYRESCRKGWIFGLNNPWS